MKAALLALIALPPIAAASATNAGPPARCGDTYDVARNDTLYSIARRCRGSVAQLMARNGIADPRRLETGRRLVLAARAGAAPRPGEAADAPRGHGLIYSMQAGDTLYSLARWARVGLRALLAANPGIDPHKIEIGDSVRLPRGAVAPDAARLRERGPPLARPRTRAPEPPPPHDAEDEAGKPDDEHEDDEDEDEDEPEDEPEGM